MPRKQSNILKLPAVMSSGAAVLKIQEIAQGDTASVIFSDHAHMRMRERGITQSQVLRVLRSGDPRGPAEWDTEVEGGWKCVFRRRAAGDKLNVVVKLLQRKDSHFNLVITTFEG